MACGQESSLEAAGTLVAAAPSPGSILHHQGGASWSLGWCGCHKDPCQTKFQCCQVPCMGVIKLQLECDVRIELAVGSFPYPGNYLDFQFVSPGRERPLSGLPICKPCLDVRQNPPSDTRFPSYGRCSLPKTKKTLKHSLLSKSFSVFATLNDGWMCFFFFCHFSLSLMRDK